MTESLANLDLVERLRHQADVDHQQGEDCCLLHMAADEIAALEFLLQIVLSGKDTDGGVYL